MAVCSSILTMSSLLVVFVLIFYLLIDALGKIICTFQAVASRNHLVPVKVIIIRFSVLSLKSYLRVIGNTEW